MTGDSINSHAPDPLGPLRLDASSPEYASVNEPFGAGRAAARMFFDFGIMLSCFRADSATSSKILDFAAGTGWISEWLNRMGYDVTAFDLDANAANIAALRLRLEGRSNPAKFRFRAGDGHAMPFADGEFSHICCFDSLHHMRDYPKAFAEFYRVLENGGRAIFVEPGARHSKSKETIEFVEKYKKNDPDWLERDVVLDEINAIARRAGFRSLRVRPFLWPQLAEYEFSEWASFRKGNRSLESGYLARLKEFNFDSRVVFYVDK